MDWKVFLPVHCADHRIEPRFLAGCVIISLDAPLVLGRSIGVRAARAATLIPGQISKPSEWRIAGTTPISNQKLFQAS